MKNKTILVTGGAGYIGSHLCVELLATNYNILVIDNLQNSSLDRINSINKISRKTVDFIKCDLNDLSKLENVFKKNRVETVIHLAGLKSVEESYNNPIKYYENNVQGSVNLFKIMSAYNVKKIIFSSSATVYCSSVRSPIKENSLLNPTTTYGKTKLIIENILNDLYTSDNKWSILNLRYFNPIGAHKSMLIGETDGHTSKNLIPSIIDVATQKKKYLLIHGSKYKTTDGTGVRDYLHVSDIALGHLMALRYLKNLNGFETFNLGAGRGYSVLEIIKIFESANNLSIPYKFVQNRQGDAGETFADIKKAKKYLGFSTKYTVEEACRDSWKYILNKKNKY